MRIIPMYMYMLALLVVPGPRPRLFLPAPGSSRLDSSVPCFELTQSSRICCMVVLFANRNIFDTDMFWFRNSSGKTFPSQTHYNVRVESVTSLKFNDLQKKFSLRRHRV